MALFKNRILPRCLALLLALSSIGVPGLGAAAGMYQGPFAGPDDGPSDADMVADAFLVRPFMLVGSVATTATFIVTLPFSLLGGNVGEAAENLVKEPWKYTLVRPLGEM
jgi:hypothetical protein